MIQTFFLYIYSGSRGSEHSEGECEDFFRSVVSTAVSKNEILVAIAPLA